MDNKVRESTFKMNKLKRCGFASKNTISEIKINQYKTYIRSTLLYGSENSLLNKKQIKDLQSTESTIMKKAFGFKSNYTHSTKLNRAVKLEKINDKLYQNKYKFLLRLQKNEYTNELINDLLINSDIQNDNESLIGYLMKLNKKKEKTLQELIVTCSERLKINRKKYNSDRKNDEVAKVINALKSKGDKRKVDLAKCILMKEHWSYDYYNNKN
jgi:hypothetical protein